MPVLAVYKRADVKCEGGGPRAREHNFGAAGLVDPVSLSRTPMAAVVLERLEFYS